MKNLGAFDIEGSQLCFLVACPRSGTTILAQTLREHDSIAHLYDPYYLWDWHPHPDADDWRGTEDFSEEQANFLRHNYAAFYRSQFGKRTDGMVLDQGPEKAFRIELIRRVFPAAKFLHQHRDGRAVTVSIQREWDKRRHYIENQNLRKFFAIIAESLGEQPILKYKALLLAHEARKRLSNLSPQRLFSAQGLMNKAKWAGKMGWGPRFAGWQTTYDQVDELSFCAHQWRASEDAIAMSAEELKRDQRLHVLSFESLLADPAESLNDLQRFLNVPVKRINSEGLDPAIADTWRHQLDAEQGARVEHVIGENLLKLGYQL